MKFQPFYGRNEKNIFTIILVFCFGLIIGLFTNLESENAVKLVITIAATFTGAFLAFKFARKNEEAKEHRIDVRAANSSIAQLIRSYNHFNGYKNQFIDPFRDSPFKAFEILPSLGTAQMELQLSIDSLSFIFQKNALLLQQVLEVQDEINSTVELITVRNDLHRNEVQKKMDEASFVHGQTISYSQLNTTLGENLFSTMIGLTETTISSVDSLCGSIEKIIEKLSSTTKEIYPRHSIVRMEKANKPQ
ncbi:YrzE family protein [Salinimonas sp. HHU 13199]|uniref:YrzE family protein n=1 Tax=Salinimonas profundi TaxID=2729140 RepID=A0ABR8LQW3_9ALTE|nr:YrzE family protein [Salinimonas profundi]MBD3586474.1 YrzE family protein [Salinimonas profundi]